jgi:hypothetical protein
MPTPPRGVARSVDLHARLEAVRDLYASPIRTSGDPPFFSTALAERARGFWRPCALAARSDIPNAIHQPWLHGATPKWEHILGMLSARFIVRPSTYTLYYDKLPPPSPQWRCACAIADCVRRRPATGVFRPATGAGGAGGTFVRVRMGHWPELMRYDLLLEKGGIFLDHDSYVLRPLDRARRCCAEPGAEHNAEHGGSCRSAAVVAGFEQEEGGRKLNPGTLMAEPRSAFLRLWRASWANYSARDWDYNCCQVRPPAAPLHPAPTPSSTA